VVSGDNDHILMGNPTNAVTDPAFPENYFKNNTYYKLAYSSSRGIPVWVAWHLQYEDRGSTSRQDDFRADTGLPSGWYQVQSNSYSGSGFDRGHNCPSADRTSTVAANSSTFLMTNMIPQAPLFNQGPWANLEDFIRNTLVGQTYEAYIVMGNYGSGGYNASGLFTTINGGKVTVPSHVYKVVLLLPKGNSDLSRINRNTTILAVDMPNNNSLYSTSSSGQTAWRNYITTVADLEVSAHAAGIPLDLFTSVADSVRGLLKLKRYL
jgi:endonuclease G